MKRVAAMAIGLAVWCINPMAAKAVDVCGYAVASAFGLGCPIHAGGTACLSVSAAIGPCDAAVACFGRLPFFCRVTLVPKSGPQARCPIGSRRLTGFSCFAPQRVLPPRTPTPAPTPTATPVTFPPTFLEQQVFRADDGTAYQLVWLDAGSAQVRITTLAASAGGTGGCVMNAVPIPGQLASAIAGVLTPQVALHPYDAIRRTAVFAPNDLSSMTFTPDFGGRLTVGTGAGAVTVCSSAFDCMGQPNVLPLVGLESATGGVPPACIANDLNAACDGANLRAAFAFGLPGQGTPPVCTDPSAVTVNTTLCGSSPTDGFTLQAGEALVFVHGLLQGFGYSTSVAGFGVSPVPVGVCAGGGVIGATANIPSTP